MLTDGKQMTLINSREGPLYAITREDKNHEKINLVLVEPF